MLAVLTVTSDLETSID